MARIGQKVCRISRRWFQRRKGLRLPGKQKPRPLSQEEISFLQGTRQLRENQENYSAKRAKRERALIYDVLRKGRSLEARAQQAELILDQGMSLGQVVILYYRVLGCNLIDKSQDYSMKPSIRFKGVEGYRWPFPKGEFPREDFRLLLKASVRAARRRIDFYLKNPYRTDPWVAYSQHFGEGMGQVNNSLFGLEECVKILVNFGNRNDMERLADLARDPVFSTIKDPAIRNIDSFFKMIFEE